LIPPTCVASNEVQSWCLIFSITHQAVWCDVFLRECSILGLERSTVEPQRSVARSDCTMSSPDAAVAAVAAHPKGRVVLPSHVVPIRCVRLNFCVCCCRERERAVSNETENEALQRPQLCVYSSSCVISVQQCARAEKVAHCVYFHQRMKSHGPFWSLSLLKHTVATICT
jgi:hypothetical protein